MITVGQLRLVMKCAPRARLDEKLDPVNSAMTAFGIDGAQARAAMYLAQVAHETGEFRYTHEIASGEAYECRRDLGNTEPGDGCKFRGRGDLQITGRTNYASCSLAVYGDARLLDTPELLELPWDGSQAGGWFWQTHGLSLHADLGDFKGVTKIINGGLNGYDSRVQYWRLAKIALGLT